MKAILKRFRGGLSNIYNRYFVPYRNKMGHISDDSVIHSPRFIIGYHNIYMYENTGVAGDNTILTPNAKFIIKRNSGCAPGLFVSTGNHERKVGRFYRTIREFEKSKDLDKDVIIEEDCWIGGNVAILSGVNVKRGTTVANGAVLTKDTVPYSIWGGVPARFIKFYWTIDQILEHEKVLYEIEERYTREQLEAIFKQFQYVK